MNLDNYKKMVRNCVENYLDGFLLSLTDFLNSFHPEVRGMFRKDTLYNKVLNEFVISVRQVYTSFISTELEFSCSKEEVDNSIKMFQDKIKELIINFEKSILAIVRTEGYQTNMITNYASCVTVKVMNDGNPRKQNELEKLRYIISLIYSEYVAIKDKNEKIEHYKKDESKYVPGTDDYKTFLADYAALTKEKDYDKFVELYNDKTKKR